MDNLVVFKGAVDGLTVILDEKAEFSSILDEFKHKLKKNKKFFKGVDVVLRFKGREVTQGEQELLLETLVSQKILGVSFVHAFEVESKSEAVESATVTNEADNSAKEEQSKTDYHYGIVRSGQQIHTTGTLVVLGDVNPGGILTAGGNVIVLGSLKGNVRAGLNMSDENNYIVALDMQPRQIGIKNILTQSPDNHKPSMRATQTPQVAYMNEQQIFVENISNKVLSSLKSSIR